MIETENNSDTSSIQKKQKVMDQTLNPLQKFTFVSVLNEDSAKKMLTILAHEKKDPTEENDDGVVKRAVIIFEKSHFGLDEIKAHLNVNCEFSTDLENDIYNRFRIYVGKPFNEVHIQLIYPATDAHIAKYAQQEYFFLRETPDDWRTVTQKHIEQQQFSLQWVYNILEHKTEAERIVFEDADERDGFVLLPDMKWDGTNADNLYLLAIVRRHGVRSLRDLTAQEHLSMLLNVERKALEAIESRYKVKASKLRAYIHYQPSFYHFHVHFSHIKNQLMGIPERNHALSTVIDNLRRCGTYYQEATLECPIRHNEPLFELYKHRLI